MNCADHRTRALDFVLDDLPPLERVRMEAHLDRCDGCRELTDRLNKAFAAARRWPPELGEQEMENLILRLEPYYLREEPRGGFGKFVFAAAALTAAIAVTTTGSKDQQPLTEALAEPIARAKVHVPVVERAQAQIVRSSPRPFVKVVAGNGWDGKVGGASARSTSILMSRGFAMIDFQGGEGRKLWVGAPNASIEVVGTRFYVDTAPNGLTTIGVISGKIVVSNGETRSAIAAGEKRTFGGAAPSSRSEAEKFAEDPFLGRHKAPAAAVAAPIDPLAELAIAERLARENNPRAALAKYDALLTTVGPTSPLGPLVRYERARLLAFTLGERARGESELRAVAGADRGEASLQAKLSLCEIQLADDRCAAASCLEDLRAREHGALSTEIDRLFQKLHLSCDHK